MVKKNTIFLAMLFTLPMVTQAKAEDALKPHIVIDSPANAQVLKKAAIIQFHAENIKLAPVYFIPGRNEKKDLKGFGHLHVYLDGQAWHWVHGGEDPLVLVGLAPGEHKIQLELAEPDHAPIDSQTLTFTIAGDNTSHAH